MYTILLGNIWWFLWTNVLCIIVYRSCIFLSAFPPTFLLSYHPKWQCKKKTLEANHKTFSEQKQAHVGMELSKINQTRWDWHHNTSHHPAYILCHYAYYAHHKTLYMHLAYSYTLSEQGAPRCNWNVGLNCFSKHCCLKVLIIAHSTVFHIKDNSYLPYSAAIKFHNIS